MALCKDSEAVASCFIPNNPETAPVGVFTHIIYNAEGEPHAEYVTVAGDPLTPIDPATYLEGGVVMPGACPVTIDKEEEVLCDDLGDSTAIPVRFVRTRICVLAANGFVTSQVVTDTALDLVTPYEVVGEVKECASDCPEEEKLGFITAFAE